MKYLYLSSIMFITFVSALQGQNRMFPEPLNLTSEELLDSTRNIAEKGKNIEEVLNQSALFNYSLLQKKDSIVTPKLINILQNPQEDWKLRFTAAEMLPQISKETKVAEELAEVLKNKEEHPYLRGVCALSLGHLGNKQYVPTLIQNLKDNSIYVRERTIWGLDLLQDQRAVQPLIGCLDDSYYMVQVLAIQTLGHLKANEALGPLGMKLDDNNISEHPEIVKHKVMRAISDIGGTGARELLLEVLTNENYGKLRVLAAEGLGDYKDEEVFETLITVLNDWDKRIQVRAAESLMKINPNRGKPIIIELLNRTESEYVKSELEKILGIY